MLRASQEEKAAIAEAVQAAKHTIILTTDADCRLSNTWVEKMTAPFASKEVSLVAGPVAFQDEETYLKRHKAWSLSATSGACNGAKQAICNGATQHLEN